ncbi:DUF853 family protein [Ignavibacteria bacterium CHB1]|nr:MAG: DUF853 family protein [Chlorobiota bacterium]MBV6398145.1 hypothetical protein [Ignavibacteria bacterium]MCC6886594.1 DUF853 family protein [Ignavibacteriales bacterium]MCE7952331.1 DUF853 family protein [Chlorobi bacterium CHB7]MDL1886449.1 DUF853 family protein [Ignavibacteria bacterium CHB1]RIK48044.1 MAG: ATPase [Ignavibacteriota bacterium]
MATKDNFTEQIRAGYEVRGESILLGGAIYNRECITGLHISLPLKTMNRHGLIAGATGTGKTKTLQVIAEGLSSKSVPTLLMDIKGDLSGIAAAGTTNEKINERMSRIGAEFKPESFPVEFLSLSEEKGSKLRATVSEFGPVLISRILELNDTQSGIVSVIFKFCDDNQLPLLDLKDFKSVLQFVLNEGKEKFESEYGRISSSSIGIITRKIIELEQQGADSFFGERSFDVQDLLKFDDQGRGIMSIIRLTDIQAKPKLFSTFMLCLLAEIYQTFPEEGDLDIPKLVIFIDEAHLIFKEASSTLLDQIETIIKLIRSKGVGIFFCTQNPTDIPDAVLSQLGMKVQHALRAFTAKDSKEIKLISENFPVTEFYKTEDLLTSLGTGEAAVTVLNEKGKPTPLVATLLRAPYSRMDILSESEIDNIISKSKLISKYNESIDRESAYEILQNKLSDEQQQQQPQVTQKSKSNEKSTFEKILSNTTTRQVGRTLVREITRGLLGALGLGRGRR